MQSSSIPTTATSSTTIDPAILASLVINGDISKLSAQQKVSFYHQFCERLGLDPLSQPFKLLRLNGREILYCDRSGAQQLNKIHKVSHAVMAREIVSGCYVVTAQASTPDGRHTECIGAVTIDNLRGDSLCNAMMKAETKAKRRATLDLLGLGLLDDTETETIPAAQKAEFPSIKTTSSVEGRAQRNLFKSKYETVEGINDALQQSKDIKDIANLYYVNAELVESDAELKARFTAKKEGFFKSDNSTFSNQAA